MPAIGTADAVDVASQWPKLTEALGFDLFEATADVGAASAILGDGAGVFVAMSAGAAAADPEVDLAVIIIAIAALIIAFAIAVLLLRPLGWLLGHIPIIGGPIQDALDSASNAIWNGVKGFVGGALSALWWLLRMLWMATLGFPGAVGKAFSAVASALHWLFATGLPQLQEWAYGQDIATAHHAQAYTDMRAGQDEAYARQLQQQAIQHADAEFRQAEQYAQALHGQAIAYANAAHADAINHANDLYRQEAAALGTAEAQLHAADVQIAEHAHAEAQQVRHQAHTELGDAVSTLTQLVTGTATALTTQFTTGLTNTTTTLTGDITQVEQKLDQYLNKCGIPLCDNLLPDAKNIGNLLSVFDDVAVLALLAALLHEPGAVAREVETVAAPLVSGGMSATLAAA